MRATVWAGGACILGDDHRQGWRSGRLPARALINARTSWWRRKSSTELVTGEIADLPEQLDIGQESADRDAAWRLVAMQPPKQRAAVVLRYYEDLDDAAIADILECSVVTVRTQTMRALATLRQRLGTPMALSSGRKQ